MKNTKAIVFLFVATALLSLSFFLPVSDWLLQFIRSIHSLGAFGGFLFGLLYVALTVLMIPGSFLTLGAGFVYGPFIGLCVVSPASVLGALLALLLGRYALRDWAQQKMQTHPKFEAIDQAVEKQGFKIIFLLRLSPLFPFNVLNYALGLTSVAVWKYVLASFLGMLPGTFLYVYIGSLATSLNQLVAGEVASKSPWHWAMYVGGLLATLFLTIYIARLAKQELNKALK